MKATGDTYRIMSPAMQYMGGYGNSSGKGDSGGRRGKKSKKDGPAQYDEQTKQLMKELGLAPPEEEDEEMPYSQAMFLGSGGMMPLGMAGGYGGGSLDSRLGRGKYAPIHTMPPSVQGPAGDAGQESYAPQGLQHATFTREGQYFDSGHNMQVAMQYVSPEGGRYNISVRTNAEDPGQAMAYLAQGFYQLIASEQSGNDYGRSGKAGKGYAKSRGSYAGKGGK